MDSNTTFEVTRKQMADGAWMRENQDRVIEALNNGTFKLAVTDGDSKLAIKEPTPGKYHVTCRQLADGVWMRENQDRVIEAQRNGTFELIG